MNNGGASPPHGAQPHGALHGLRVLDLSRVLSGPYCTQILADHGADVLKVESPAGDETRTWGPPFVDGVAAYFQGVNRNKRATTLDLSTPADRQRLLAMLEEADVLVENFKPGQMAGWGFGPETLAERFPRLVHCSITGFGESGPLGGLPGYDAAVQAMAGLMTVNGDPGHGATRVGVPIVDMVTGLNAAIGILMAIQERAVSGRGQRVTTALFDCALSILHPHTATYFASGRVPVQTGNSHPNITPYDVLETRTVPVFLAVGNDRQFARLCERLGAAALAADPRFAANRDRCDNREALMSRLRELMAAVDGRQLADDLMRAGVPCSAVLNVAEALQHPHAVDRQAVVQIDGYRGIASPIRLDRTPPTYRRPPPMRRETSPDGWDPA